MHGSKKNYVYTALSCSMFFGGNNESDLIGENKPLVFLLLTAILVSVMSKGPNMRVQNILVKCVITFPPSLWGKPVRWRHYCLFDFFTDWFVFPARLAACSAPHKSLPSVAPQCLPLLPPSPPLQAASLHWRNFNWFVQWISAGRTNIFSLDPSTIFHELPWALSFVNSFKISALKNFQYSFETWSNPTYFQTFQL